MTECVVTKSGSLWNYGPYVELSVALQTAKVAAVKINCDGIAMKRLWLPLLLICSWSTVALSQSGSREYQATGKTLKGSPYTGRVWIGIDRSGCAISWHTGSGNSYQSTLGYCLVQGNALSAGYKNDNNDFCFILYKIDSDGSMSGPWRCLRETGQGFESLKLFRIRPE